MISKQTLIRGIIGLSIALAAVVAYGALLYIVQSAQMELTEERTLRATAAARVGEYIALEKQAAQLSEARSELASYVVPHDGVVPFLALIESLGNGAGTTVETTNITVTEGDGVVDTINLQLRAEGSYRGVIETLQLLETLPYRTEVVSVNIQSVEADVGWTGDFIITVLKEREI